MAALGLALGLPFGSPDSSPGGASNVWLWEDGIGMQWEAGIFILTE